jgi:hypothetical protein
MSHGATGKKVGGSFPAWKNVTGDYRKERRAVQARKAESHLQTGVRGDRLWETSRVRFDRDPTTARIHTMCGNDHRRFVVVLIVLALLPAVAPVGRMTLRADEDAKRAAEAGNDPVRLLELSSRADEDTARRLRTKVRELLQANARQLDSESLRKLAQRIAHILPAVAGSAAEVTEVLGKPGKTSRQIVFRQFLEQWTYEHPLPLIITFQYRQGQPARVRSARLSERK